MVGSIRHSSRWHVNGFGPSFRSLLSGKNPGVPHKVLILPVFCSLAAASDLIFRPPFPAIVALADARASERRRWRRPSQPSEGPRLREDDEKTWFSGIHPLSAARLFSPSRRRKPGLLASGFKPLKFTKQVQHCVRQVLRREDDMHSSEHVSAW